MVISRTFLPSAMITIALGFAACNRTADSANGSVNPDDADLSRKAGQLMMVAFRGPELTPAIRETLRELHPGGVCLYAQNVTGAERAGKLNDDLRLCLDEWMPPFIAIDQEGGVVVRIYDGAPVFPSMMVLGATRSPQLALAAGETFGRDLRLLGVNMNLAP